MAVQRSAVARPSSPPDVQTRGQKPRRRSKQGTSCRVPQAQQLQELKYGSSGGLREGAMRLSASVFSVAGPPTYVRLRAARLQPVYRPFTGESARAPRGEPAMARVFNGLAGMESGSRCA